MALPILKHPTFDLTVPTTGNKVLYRPFLVKEEKILLLAQQSNKVADLVRAVKQILNNCLIEGEVNLETISTFDIEYIFLKLRTNSVNDNAKFKFTDTETDKEVNIELDLNDVEIVHTDGHTNIIKLNDDVTLEMKYPNYSTLADVDSPEIVKVTFDMIKACVDKILVGEGDEQEVHEFKDYSTKEVDDFIDSLTTQNFTNVQEFFDTMPKLQHEVEYKVGKKTKTRKFVGLADFFPSA